MQFPGKTPLSEEHVGRLCRSYKRWTSKHLFPPEEEMWSAVVQAPFVVVSHGIGADPVFNFGNPTALRLWELTWDEFTRTPSRQTAEPVTREERARLLKEVTAHGFIANYHGIRITPGGRRFRIENVTVWNVEENGVYLGQAATFDKWVFLES